jgi:hypothetical protein
MAVQMVFLKQRIEEQHIERLSGCIGVASYRAKNHKERSLLRGRADNETISIAPWQQPCRSIVSTKNKCRVALWRVFRPLHALRISRITGRVRGEADP